MILVTMEYVPVLVYSQPRDMEGTHRHFLARDSVYSASAANDFMYRWAHERQNSLQSCATEFLNRQLGIKLFPYTHKIPTP